MSEHQECKQAFIPAILWHNLRSEEPRVFVRNRRLPQCAPQVGRRVHAATFRRANHMQRERWENGP